MADSPAPKPAATSEDLYREIKYVREDIRDLRNQIGGIHHRIDETNRSLGERIHETNRSLGERIDETNRSLNAYFRWTIATLVAMTGILSAVIKL